MQIERLGVEQVHHALPELIEVLWDAVDSGAAKIGYVKTGVIPQYARRANGLLDTTTIFYKLL